MDTLTIEIGDARNRNVQWPMTRDILRGAWKRHNLLASEMNDMDGFVPRIPDLPGMYVRIDTRRSAAWILDPLNKPEHTGTMAALNALAGIAPVFGFTKAKPEDDREFPNLTATHLKSWLYWARRIVDAKSATVIEGALPSLSEIAALPGKTMTQCGDSTGRARFREDLAEVARLNAEVLLPR